MQINIIMLLSIVASFLLYVGLRVYYEKKDIIIEIENKQKNLVFFGLSFEVEIDGKLFTIKKQDDYWLYRFDDGNWKRVEENRKEKSGSLSFTISSNNSSLFFRNVGSCFIASVMVIPIIYMCIVSYGHDIELERVALTDPQKNNTENISSDYDIREQVDSELKDERNINQDVLSIVRMAGWNIDRVGEKVELKISDRTTFWAANNDCYNVESLINRKLCLFFKGENGEDCFFLGQYNEKYHWDKECSICVYKDGKLLSVTNDEYDDGKLTNYERISSGSSRKSWVYSKKSVDPSGKTYGDTRNYEFVELVAKEYSTDNPVEDCMYSVDELTEKLSGGIKNHYNGCYDNNQNWDDNTGNAYSVKYERGNITEIFKGVYYNNRYGEGILLVPRKDGRFEYSIGKFHDRNGNTVKNGVSTRIITADEAWIYVHGEQFEEEVKKIFE